MMADPAPGNAASADDENEEDMNIVDLLTREHDDLRSAMARLAGNGSRWPEAEAFARALELHARLEDDLLFVELEAKLPTDNGPLPVMRAEHAEIEDGLARLESLEDTAPEWRPLLTRVLGVARSHFEKEERVLFAFASHQIEASRLEALGEQFERARHAAKSASQ